MNKHISSFPINKRGLTVFVKDNNVEAAGRLLKKRMTMEGVFKEMRERRFYEKPSLKRKAAKSRAKKRLQKALQTRDGHLQNKDY